MFMIELTFAVSLSTLHGTAAAHLRFLRRHYTLGHLPDRTKATTWPP
jgi:hypothetical protein